MDKIPIYELILTDDNSVGIALVESPAIEEDFIYFSEQEVAMRFNDEQMMVEGVVLIPFQRIFRNDSLGVRYVYLSKESIRLFAEKFLSKKDAKFNIGHTDNIVELGVIESYFAKEGNYFGVPEGSWIVSAKVYDEKAWQMIKNGELKGFSMQGIFSNILVEEENINFNKEKMELKEKLMNAINTILFADEKPTEKLDEAKVDEKVDEVQVEKFNADELLTALNEKLEAFKVGLLDEFNAKVKEVSDSVGNLSVKVEEFSKQPLSTSVTEEEVNVPVASKGNKAVEFFKN